MPALLPSLRQSSFPKAPPIASLSIKMVRKNHNVMSLSSMVHPLIRCPQIYIYVFISFILCLSDHVFICIYLYVIHIMYMYLYVFIRFILCLSDHVHLGGRCNCHRLLHVPLQVTGILLYFCSVQSCSESFAVSWFFCASCFLLVTSFER